jgi:lipopolysaccharide/colanic/teichoic acid biosynthesis glycosyltransferase
VKWISPWQGAPGSAIQRNKLSSNFCTEATLLTTQFNLQNTEAGNTHAPTYHPRRRQRGTATRSMVRPRGGRFYVRCKAAFDFVAAALLAIPAVPLVAVIAVLVKLTSRGPAFYTQARVGKDGRLFTIYKVRTMIDKCESLTGPRWSMPGDPRVTPIGWLLRTTHLDELPQLLNVLRGDMSLIGPRPERPEFVPELERVLPAYQQRLLIRPGVTGLAQVQLPADTDLESVQRKLAYDLFYIEHLSPWLDVRLLVATALYALGVSFTTLGKLTCLPTFEQIQRATAPLVDEGPVGHPRHVA